MFRSGALCALALLSGAVRAATPVADPASPKVPPHPGHLPLKLEPIDNSLQQLLDAGYEIHTSSGDDGAVLFLSKPDLQAHTVQWVRCEMIGDNNNSLKLIFSHRPTTDCRVLN